MLLKNGKMSLALNHPRSNGKLTLMILQEALEQKAEERTKTESEERIG